MKRKMLALGIFGLALLIVLVSSFSLLNSKVDTDQTALTAANSLYETGQYKESIQIYDQLIDQGIEDSSLFYNLGNAYYRIGDYGRSILNYQRAAHLNPRDQDIKANLEMAAAAANLEVPDIAPGPLTLVSEITSRWLSLNEAALLALGLWFGVLFLFFAWRVMSADQTPGFLRIAAVGVSVIFLVVIMSIGSRLYIESLEPGAVVIDPVVTLRSEPGNEFDTDFEIPAGSSVDLLEQQGEWILLSGPGDTYQGWVPAGAVEQITIPQDLNNFNA